MKFRRSEAFFLIAVFLVGAGFRLGPHLALDPHLLTFHADIWYRLCLAQYVVDNHHLPPWDIRYLAYGHVPVWYNPGSIFFLAWLSELTKLDLPTVSSRIMPVLESLTLIPFYFLCRELYGVRAAVAAAVFLLLSPTFIFWTGIATLQSLTIFLLPISILLWVRFVRSRFVGSNKWIHLTVMGAILALNFWVHLTYFSHVIILALVQLGLIIERRARWRDYLYLLVPVAISQIVTAPWWLSGRLYWWWSKGLTTSWGYTGGMKFLTEYGVTTAVLGHLALAALIVYVIWKRRALPAYYLLPVFWALFPLIESQNEGLLTAFHKLELSWNNFFKPLEGFRFYVFLAMPLALCFGLWADRSCAVMKKGAGVATALLLAAVLVWDMFYLYKLPGRFQVTGMEMKDIKAARWFKEHTPPDARILADYYMAQMFSGICGGKALLGSLFPLKDVDIPYINERTKVQADIYSVYLNYSVPLIKDVLHRYGVTHLLVSDRTIGYINTLANRLYNKPVNTYKPDKEKLLNLLSSSVDFTKIYTDEDIAIFQLNRP